MKRSAWIWVLSILLAAQGAVGRPLDKKLAPDTVEGTIGAATCLGSKEQATCNVRALSAGQPGGLVVGRQFIMLLIDARILGRSCAVATTGRLRASGVLHRRGLAMSVFRLEQDCGHGWIAVDLPYTGSLAEGAGGGDE